MLEGLINSGSLILSRQVALGPRRCQEAGRTGALSQALVPCWLQVVLWKPGIFPFHCQMEHGDLEQRKWETW